MATIRDHLTAHQPSITLPPALPVVDDRFPPLHGVEQPLSPMAESYLPGLLEVARSLHQKILVVGCRWSNLGPKLADHPKLILWNSQDEAKWTRQRIPREVGAMLLLKWISHPASNRLMDEAKERGIHYTGLISTGDVRQLLHLALKDAPRLVRGETGYEFAFAEPTPTPSEPAPPPPIAPAPGPAGPDPAPTPSPSDPPPTVPTTNALGHNRGLTGLLTALGADVHATPHVREAERLLGQVRETFPTATKYSVASTLSQMRLKTGARRIKVRASVRALEAARHRPTTPQEPPAEAQAPTTVSVPATSQTVTVAPEEPVVALPPAAPPVPKVTQAADVSIDDALSALAAAENAIHAAMESLLSARRNMAQTIVAEIQTGVQQALADTLARFGK